MALDTSPVENARALCPACKQMRHVDQFISGELLPSGVAAQIVNEHPDWSPEMLVCPVCVNVGKAGYLEELLEGIVGTLSDLDREVIASIRTGETLTEDSHTSSVGGEAAADRVAAAVGSWRFPIGILTLLAIWISLNLLFRPFEPYPTIVLAMISAVLGSLAALQGPIILFSQRKQAQRDRMRAQNDYRVNLKAELEIQYLNKKLDLVLERQEKIWGVLENMKRME